MDTYAFIEFTFAVEMFIRCQGNVQEAWNPSEKCMVPMGHCMVHVIFYDENGYRAWLSIGKAATEHG